MFLGSILAVNVSADTRYWAGVGGSGIGDFNVPGNWQQGAVPGASRSLDIGRFLTSYIDAIPPLQKPSIFLCLGRKHYSL